MTPLLFHIWVPFYPPKHACFRENLHSMEVAEEIEHIPYGDEITSFQDALKGNSANFEKRLGRVWFDLTQWTFCLFVCLFRPVVFQDPHIYHSGAGQKRWNRRGGELAGDWSYQQVWLVYLQLYLDEGRSVICFQRIEEAVAGLKEGEAEVEGALRKMERGAESVSALRSKVRWTLNLRDLDTYLPPRWSC